MQEALSGFKLNVPSMDAHVFPPGTTVLLTGRPGAGKSVFAEQFLLEGLQRGQNGIYVVMDTSGESLKRKVESTPAVNAKLELVNLFLEKPRLINDISISVHQAISKYDSQQVRLAFDSLSTLGMLFNPEVLPPWVLDQRARFTKHRSNVLALMVYDLGIHSPQITRSLQVLSDVVLEMKLQESEDEPKRLFRVFSSRDTPHSAKWYQFVIDNSGLRFEEHIGT